MKDLSEARKELNNIDDGIKELFIKRMNIIKDIAIYKKSNNLQIFDPKREEEMIERLSKDTGELKEYYVNLLKEILKESKKYQEVIIKQ